MQFIFDDHRGSYREYHFLWDLLEQPGTPYQEGMFPPIDSETSSRLTNGYLLCGGTNVYARIESPNDCLVCVYPEFGKLHISHFRLRVKPGTDLEKVKAQVWAAREQILNDVYKIGGQKCTQ